MAKFEKFLIMKGEAAKEKKCMPKFESEVSNSKQNRADQTEVIGIFFPEDKCPLQMIKKQSKYDVFKWYWIFASHHDRRVEIRI